MAGDDRGITRDGQGGRLGDDEAIVNVKAQADWLVVRYTVTVVDISRAMAGRWPCAHVRARRFCYRIVRQRGVSIGSIPRPLNRDKSRPIASFSPLAESEEEAALESVEGLRSPRSEEKG